MRGHSFYFYSLRLILTADHMQDIVFSSLPFCGYAAETQTFVKTLFVVVVSANRLARTHTHTLACCRFHDWVNTQG